MRVLFLLVAIVFSQLVLGQSTDEVSFYLEGQGNVVRLRWIIKNTWPVDLLGFELKKRIKGENSWEPVGKGTFLPSVDNQTDLSGVVGNKSELKDLEFRRDTLISKKYMRPFTNSQFTTDMGGKEKGMFFFAYAMQQDFDRALISGFGCIDRHFENPKATYEYGLFPVNKNGSTINPIKTLEWKYGDVQLYDIEYSYDFERNSFTDGINILWNINKKEHLENRNIVGFNVYQEVAGKRKLINNKENASKDKVENLYLLDSRVPKLKKDSIYTFTIKPVSAFNTEHPGLTFTLNPNIDLPYNAKVELSPLQCNESGVCVFNWKVSGVNPKMIQGFVLGNADGAFEEMSDTLGPEVFSYTDSSKRNEWSNKFRIQAILKNGFGPVYSNKEEFYYVKPLPTPTNLKAQLILKDGKRYAHLSWDKQSLNLEMEYYVYQKLPADNSYFRLASLPEVKTNEVIIDLNHVGAQKYKFKVRLNRFDYFSEYSNEIELISPTLNISWFFLKGTNSVGKKVELQWTITDYIDLYKYIFIVDGQEVYEFPYQKNMNKWTSPKLTPGKHEIQLKVVTTFGIEGLTKGEHIIIK